MAGKNLPTAKRPMKIRNKIKNRLSILILKIKLYWQKNKELPASDNLSATHTLSDMTHPWILNEEFIIRDGIFIPYIEIAFKG